MGKRFEYRDIKDFPNYKVGNDGSVWSCQKYHSSTEWRKLKLVPVGIKGYLMAGLYKKGTLFKRLIHHLVLEAFVGPRQKGMECCHFPDPSPSNNNLSNLRWGTIFDNARDKKIHGTSGGWKLGIETRNKMSAFQKGRKHSQEHNAKVAEANRGRKATDEARKNMRIARMKWLAEHGR